MNKKQTPSQSFTSTNQDVSMGFPSHSFVDGCKLAQLGQYEKAKLAFTNVDSNCDEYGRAQYLFGCACNKLDEYQQAIDAFKQALYIFEENEEIIPVDFYYQKGFAYWKLGEYQDAIKSFSTFIEKTEEDNVHNGYLNRGLVYSSMGNFKEALSDLNEANKEIENQTIYSLCCRGRILAYLGQYEKAKEDFQAALHIDPQDFQSYLQLGIAYSELGQYSQALEQFNHALESQSDNKYNRAEIYFRQALIYHSLGNSDIAIKKLLDAVALNSKHARAYFRLGRAYLIENKYFEALEALNTAHTLAPQDKDIIYELGTLYERTERLNLALHERRRAFGFQQTEPVTLELSDSEDFIPIETLNSIPSSPYSPQVEIRRNMNVHLLSAIEQEELLPFTENRLASYNKVLEEYQLAIDSDECPEAYAFMALCQEAEKDFVNAYQSMENLYNKFQNDPNVCKLWLECLEQFSKDNVRGELSTLVAHRYSVMKRIEANRIAIKTDHQIFENDSSGNCQNFYDVLRRRLSESLVAFSLITYHVPVVLHNLKDSSNSITWIVNYMSKPNSFVSAFGFPLDSSSEKGLNFLYTKDYKLIQDKLFPIASMGNHTDFFTVARQTVCEITDRYKDQLIRLNKNPTHSSTISKTKSIERESIQQRQNTEEPNELIANFAIKYVIETIRDQNLITLGFSPKSKTNIDELATILVNIICSAKSNQQRRLFKFTKDKDNHRLPIQHPISSSRSQDNHWLLYEFFRAPGIKLDNGSKYEEASWMKPTLYGYRSGTLADINIIQKEIEDIQTKKCV